MKLPTVPTLKSRVRELCAMQLASGGGHTLRRRRRKLYTFKIQNSTFYIQNLLVLLFAESMQLIVPTRILFLRANSHTN